MVELKSFIDETFNNLKSKIEEEYNNKIKDHFSKISIDVCNDSYSKDEYGKIDIGKIKHPEGRYIIHKIEFNRSNLDLIKDPLQNSEFYRYYEQYNGPNKYKNIKKLFIPGTMLIDNFGERYIFIKSFTNYNGDCLKYINEYSPNIKGNPHHSVNITNINEFEYQLIPSKDEYEYPLTNKIIDFVKSQNFPIENLNTLSKIMASVEIYKKTYNKKEYDELDNLTDELISNLDEKKETNNEKNKEGEQIRIKKLQENLEKNKSQLEYGVKQELLGRIEALYKLKNLTRPLGLPLLSIEKLQNIYSKMKSDSLSNSYSYEN